MDEEMCTLSVEAQDTGCVRDESDVSPVMTGNERDDLLMPGVFVLTLDKAEVGGDC